MKLKRKKEIVIEIMKPLEEQGFTFATDNSFDNSVNWDYVRTRNNGVIQIISVYDNGFYVNMSLSLLGVGNPEYKVAQLIDPDNIIDMIAGYWYENEVMFRQHIAMFCDIALKKGIALLTELSDVDLENVPEISPQKFAIMEQIQKRSDLKVLSYEEICNKLNELEGRRYTECKMDLLILAVEYGNWIISRYGGAWGKCGKQFLVEKCGKNGEMYVNTLTAILGCWKRRSRWSVDIGLKEHDKLYS